MVRTAYSYPAILEPDEDGRLVVRFPALPEALTDGADEAEALREAADCLSEALASRIVDGEEIPPPAPLASDQHLISPDPTIALKAALYMQLRQRDMTIADLADRLGVADWHQAARLVDPRRSSKLTSLATALDALGCRIAVSVEAPAESVLAAGEERMSERLGQPDAEHTKLDELEIAEHVLARLGGKTGRQASTMSLSDATLKAVQAHGEGVTASEVMVYLAREFGMTVKPNQLGAALQRHRRAHRLENRDQHWFISTLDGG